MLLAPPTQEQLAQRRFSEVNAAIERHNMRKAAKRSQRQGFCVLNFLSIISEFPLIRKTDTKMTRAKS